MNGWHRDTCSRCTVYAFRTTFDGRLYKRYFECYHTYAFCIRALFLPSPIFFVCSPAFRGHFHSVRTVNFIRISRFCRSMYGLRPHGLPTLDPFHMCVRTIELKSFRRTVVVTPCGRCTEGFLHQVHAKIALHRNCVYVNIASMPTHASECGTTGRMHASCPIMTYQAVSVYK